MNTLEMNGVLRHFGDPQPVLAGVELSIDRGEVVGLLGRNGAGKTTLLRLVLGMLHPQKGDVRVFGMDPAKHPVEVKQRVGYVSESQALPHYLRAKDVIAMHAELFPSWDASLAKSLKERFQINGAAKIDSMSKGEARKVAVLCAIAHRPDLLLLDEPASGFDPVARREFLEAALDHLSDTGSTILFSTHQMTDIERIASRVVFLDGGRLILDEPLDELREEMTLVTVARSAADAATLRAIDGCVTARMDEHTSRALLRGTPEGTLSKVAPLTNGTPPSVRNVSLEELFIELVESSPAGRARRGE